MRIPTVKVVSPAAPDGYIVINESDREPHHELWTGEERVAPPRGSFGWPITISDDPTAPAAAPATGIQDEDDFGPDDASLRVSKGPRGKFYVKSGKEHIHGPFETEEEAMAAMVGISDTP